MATTTNYAWETPDDTDLVKDGAAAIRTLGSSIDTTTKALNPETTLGDISYRSSTANTKTRLGIGTTGQVLTVSGGVPAWETPTSTAGMTLITANTFSSVSSVSLPNNTFTSTYRNYLVNFNLTGKSTFSAITGRFRASGTDNTNSNYSTANQAVLLNNSTVNTLVSNGTSFTIGYINDPGIFATTLTFFQPQATDYKRILGQAWGTDSGPNASGNQTSGFLFGNTTSFDSFTFICASGTFSGNYEVYGLGI